MRVTLAFIVVAVGPAFRSAALCDDSITIELFARYCTDCHGEKRQEGGLDIGRALEQKPLVRNTDVWENVYERVRSRQMPPPKKKRRPTEDERQTILSWIDQEVRGFDYDSIDDPGHEPARRLTHHEYENTVRDLFGVAVDVVGALPAELEATSGFDNSANSLFLQPTLLERYLGVAERVVANALPVDGPTPLTRAARERIFVAAPSTSVKPDAAAREILARFVPRAYRRPTSFEEVEEYVEIFRVATSGGLGFEPAVKKALEAILVSPYFLLRAHGRRKSPGPYRVGHHEMASRLSYFLWASTPDDELLELARKEKLHDEDVLERQVGRLLRDERSSALGRLFASQWLGSDQLGVRVRPDPIDNPFMTDSLMVSMQEETVMFFSHLLAENRPISELVDANYSFVNEELAKHYGVAGVRGHRLRRVAMDTSQRGGIFGHAGLLMVTSHPGRTSPVLRGRWILADVLGMPPPPPPPNASELSPEVERRRRLSQREKLELHRVNPACAGCHSRIDPLGFSLQNFDRFGRWRERRGRSRIDARGRLPNWTEFTGPSGLKRVVVEQHLDDLTRQLARKMLAYGLGRQLEYYDVPAVRKIVTKVQDDGYRLRTLVLEVARSYPFRYRKNRTGVSRQEKGG